MLHILKGKLTAFIDSKTGRFRSCCTSSKTGSEPCCSYTSSKASSKPCCRYTSSKAAVSESNYSWPYFYTNYNPIPNIATKKTPSKLLASNQSTSTTKNRDRYPPNTGTI